MLKDGIAFEPNGRGTYVKDLQELPFAAPEVAPAPEAPAGSAAEATLVADQAFRRRLIGVFDELTGLPLVGAEVVEVATGTIAKTTATGTASLAFLPEGQSRVEVRRAGYATLKLDVSISPRDTLPITLLLARP